MRRAQLGIANQVLTKAIGGFASGEEDEPEREAPASPERSCNGAAVLCGDFNFDSTRNYDGSVPLENEALAAGMWVCLWRVWPPVRDSTRMRVCV